MDKSLCLMRMFLRLAEKCAVGGLQRVFVYPDCELPPGVYKLRDVTIGVYLDRPDKQTYCKLKAICNLDGEDNHMAALIECQKVLHIMQEWHGFPLSTNAALLDVDKRARELAGALGQEMLVEIIGGQDE